jgi:two-component system, OmpR family, KDP operon response regulator KdpE
MGRVQCVGPVRRHSLAARSVDQSTATHRPLVLVVDDDELTCKFIAANLKTSGYNVLVALGGKEAIAAVNGHVLDLVLLDIGIPEPDGLQVLSAIRRRTDVPVIMLSARGLEHDKITALDLGADDYVTKPFAVGELLARVRAALRRSGSRLDGAPTVYRSGDLEVDLGSRRVRLAGTVVDLTRKEYELLAYLALRPGIVASHRQILQAVWGESYGAETQYLWVYVSRIRRKIEPDPDQPRYLLTEPGVGYYVPPLCGV